MASFTLKNIPDDIYDALKRQAADNNRSINQEVIVCIRMALARPKRTRADAQALLARIDQTNS